MKNFVGLTLLCLLFFGVSASAQDPVASPEATPTSFHRRPIVHNETYEKSRYTSDRSEAEADHVSFLLAVGNDKIIDLDPSFEANPDRKETIFTGNVAVVNVAMIRIGSQVQLVIKPLAEGETNVTIRDKTGKVRIILDITVAKQNLVKYLDRLKDRLKEVEGITIGIEDQKIVIRGEVLTPNDYGTIVNEIADKTYGDAVINKATMSNITLGALAKKIEQDVQVFAPTVRTNVLNGKIILDGSVESEGIRSRVLKRAEWFLPAVKISDPVANAANAEKNDKPVLLIQNDIQVTPPPPKRDSKLVRLTIYFIELNKDFLKSFAFKWQPGFTAAPSIQLGQSTNGATTIGDSNGFTFSGTLSSLFPTFSSNPSSASYGRVMKTETLVVKSESKGHIDNYQQLPTQQVGQNGTTGSGTPQNVGTSLDITPKILQGQDVDLDIDLKESALAGKGIGGASITNNRGVTTRLYVKSGDTAAVAGINTQDATTTFNRDDPNATTAAAGGTTQALFNLQRSKNWTKDRGQFVVFITPQIVENASDGTEDLKKNFRIPTSNR
jgi:pilus assembly protein CpaC